MSTSRTTANRYRTPGVLEPIQLLDWLELSGTTAAAAQALGVSQPTVSRRSRRLIQELSLQSRRPKPLEALRYRETTCLRLLRRASQWHRLEAGSWRLGASPWQLPVLRSMPSWAAAPLRFRHPLAWRELLEAHAIDGALISGLDLQQALPDGLDITPDPALTPIRLWQGCLLHPLPQQRLGLLLPPDQPEPPPSWETVAVPPQQAAPGLASLVRQRQWHCLQAPQLCQEPQAWGSWLEHVRRPLLASMAWAEALKPHLGGWHWWPWPQSDGDQLWLLSLSEVWQEHQGLASLPALLASAIRRFDAWGE